MKNPIAWLKARLAEPSTHNAILGLLNSLAVLWFLVPGKYAPFVLAAAALLSGLGFALPEGLAKRVADAERKEG